MNASSSTPAIAAPSHHLRSPRFGGGVPRVEEVSDMGEFGCRHSGRVGRDRTARERLRKDTHRWAVGRVGSPHRGRVTGGPAPRPPDRSPEGYFPWSGLEAVAHAGLGDEVAGPGVVVLELASDAAHE